MSHKDLTQTELKSVLNYCPNSGLFTWSRFMGSRAPKGGVAGYKDKRGCIDIRVNGVLQKAHRLAFLYMTGEWPIEVDHIDHDPSNNKWENLRDTKHEYNMRNQSLRRTNTSGHTGVIWIESCQRWYARICVKGKSIHLGTFLTKDEAIRAREVANYEHNFHANHGS